jgi:hypothetical protein
MCRFRPNWQCANAGQLVSQSPQRLTYGYRELGRYGPPDELPAHFPHSTVLVSQNYQQKAYEKIPIGHIS